jgi:hypothetical protein
VREATVRSREECGGSTMGTEIPGVQSAGAACSFFKIRSRCIDLATQKRVASASKASGRFMGGNPMLLRAEPGKQRPRSCRTQELARSSGQQAVMQVLQRSWDGSLTQATEEASRAESDGTVQGASSGTHKPDTGHKPRPNGP